MAVPRMSLDERRTTFSAVTSGGTFVSQTAAQIVRLTQNGGVTCDVDRHAESTLASGEPSVGYGIGDVVDRRHAGGWLACEWNGHRQRSFCR